jgi:hypothetical protein
MWWHNTVTVIDDTFLFSSYQLLGKKLYYRDLCGWIFWHNGETSGDCSPWWHRPQHTSNIYMAGTYEWWVILSCFFCLPRYTASLFYVQCNVTHNILIKFKCTGMFICSRVTDRISLRNAPFGSCSLRNFNINPWRLPAEEQFHVTDKCSKDGYSSM